ncbi:MAG: hypothetical protein AB1679_29880 [Actinomycetota bacterium]
MGCGLALFVAAMLRKAPPLLGGIGGFVGGVGFLLPLSCASSYDGVEHTICHSALGIPISEAIGAAAGLMLGVAMVVLVIVFRTEGGP